MLRSGAVRHTRYFTGQLKNELVICSMEDVVTTSTNGVPVMTLNRKAALKTWGRVERTRASNYSVEGRNMMAVGAKPKQTHLIIIRSRHDINFSTAAWIYEERLQSSPRWYKILDWIEDEDFTLFEAHIYERSDNATPPEVQEETRESSILSMVPLPQGVRL